MAAVSHLNSTMNAKDTYKAPDYPVGIMRTWGPYSNSAHQGQVDSQ